MDCRWIHFFFVWEYLGPFVKQCICKQWNNQGCSLRSGGPSLLLYDFRVFPKKKTPDRRLPRSAVVCSDIPYPPIHSPPSPHPPKKLLAKTQNWISVNEGAESRLRLTNWKTVICLKLSTWLSTSFNTRCKRREFKQWRFWAMHVNRKWAFFHF